MGGAVSAAPINGGTQRWSVPAGREMWAVGDIGWRMGAMYCNWLHNNKANTREAFLNGAYDVSTFGGSGNFTDQATRSPGARYWIPSWDEWLKAAHYDPNKFGQGQEGWWLYSTTSDTAPIAGPPSSMAPQSMGQVNTAGGQFFGVNPFTIPLGAYADVTSPWGLYDVAGATGEWTEEILTLASGNKFRIYDGSWWLDGDVGIDMASVRAGDQFPNVFLFENGLRIASAVPGPQTGLPLVCAGACAVRKRRRDEAHETCSDIARKPVHLRR